MERLQNMLIFITQLRTAGMAFCISYICAHGDLDVAKGDLNTSISTLPPSSLNRDYFIFSCFSSFSKYKVPFDVFCPPLPKRFFSPRRYRPNVGERGLK